MDNLSNQPSEGEAPEEIEKNIKILMFSKIPEDGSSIGNKKLLQCVQEITNLNADTFWKIRNELIEDGKISTGRGKGGSVFRINLKRPDAKISCKENEIYRPFHTYLETNWVKLNNITQYICEITASQGKRDTGGKWTRPDLSLISVQSYPYYPGKILELISFEIKTENGYGIESVFETAAHSYFAHKSYLAIYFPSGKRPDTPEFDRIEKECKRFGVGLITFEDYKTWESFEIIVESEWKSPDPSEVNAFINTQIKKENQQKILTYLK